MHLLCLLLPAAALSDAAKVYFDWKVTTLSYNVDGVTREVLGINNMPGHEVCRQQDII
jgi:hypothetical protein